MTSKRNRITVVISVLLIFGFLFTSLASYFVSLASLRSEIANKALPLTSDNIYSEIQRDLLPPIFISSMMAKDTFFRDWVVEGEKDVERIAKYLKEIKTEYNTFACFFVSEKTRNYYYSGGILKKVKRDEPRDKWYFRVRDMESDYEINVDPDMANKDAMTIFINFRVYDYNGRYIGATGVGLTVNAVKRLIEDYQARYGCSIYFIDDRGAVILHGSSLRPPFENIRDVDGISPIADRIKADGGSSFRYKGKEGTVHVNTRHIPEFDWHLIVEQTERKATKPIIRALFINLLLCGAITALVVLLITMTVSAYQRRMEKMAAIDKLTGLYNRQAFDVLLEQALKDYQRKRDFFSLVLFDIDYFKKVNDRFGHLAGDAVIRHIARITAGILRSSDALCRWGGDEFMVLLKDCSLEDAFVIAEKIRHNIENLPTVHDRKEIPVTVSLGVARYENAEDEKSLLGRADRALYAAKQGGRAMTKTAVSDD